MTSGAVSTRPADGRAGLWLNILTVWHGLYAVGCLAALYIIWQGVAERSQWQLVLLTVLAALGAVGNAATVMWVVQRNHRGRVASLVLNYLGFLAFFFGALQAMDIFIALNDLSGTFGRGVPFLFLAFIGYLISAYGDRFDDNPAQQRLFNRIGRAVILVGLALFFIRISTVAGLMSLASQLLEPRALLLVIGALLFALMLWAMWRPPSAEALQANNAHTEILNGWLFLSPNLLGFLVFFAGPLLFSLYISFTDADAFRSPNFIGLENYAKVLNVSGAALESPTQRFNEVMDVKVYSELTRVNLFGRIYVIGAEDKLFWLALRNTLLFVLMAVPLSVIPALFLSNLLNSKLPGMKFFRAVYFIPSIAAVVGIALIWQLLFNAAIGYINYGITSLVNFINGAGLVTVADPQVRWLSDSRTALLSLVIIVVWQTMGFNTVLFLAGLQNIPRDLYEAATVDGAGRWAQFWHITLPMLTPTTFFVVTTTTIQAMQLFDQVFILINPPAGPNNSTLTMVLYLYQQGFQRFNQGYASAIAWVLFILIFGVTLLQYQRQRSSAYEG